MDSNLETRIRSRAYQLWQNDPSPEGNAEAHWEIARRQIEAEGDPAQSDPASGADQSADRETGERPAAEQKLQDVSPEPATRSRTARRQRA